VHKRTAAIVLSGAILIAYGGCAAAQETGSPPGSHKATSAAARSHYIEFRAARIGTYGHSYVVYGRLNVRGEPADFHYTDRHPMGNYAVMAIGHVLPVPANTKWDPEVLALPVSSSYRHSLTAAQYQKLLHTVRAAEAEKAPTWNALSNNCNHYAARLARAAGLKAPDDLQLSYGFVPTLRELNARPASQGRAVSSVPDHGDRNVPAARKL
jgi:hypothetical protein